MITHSGIFHPDEVMATAILVFYLKKRNKWYKIIRTRDEKIFEKYRKLRKKGKEVYIYDVGNIYNENDNEFDHHQIEGVGKRENGIEYSSAGLVWKKVGLELVGYDKDIFKNIDLKLIQSIDALDNGQKIFEPLYDIGIFDLNFLIRFFYPEKKDEKNYLKSFKKAFIFLNKILEKEIKKEKKKKRDLILIKEIYKKSKDKRFFVLENENISGEVVNSLNFPELIFYIKKKGKEWIIWTVKKEEKGFDFVAPLPKEWAGLRGEELDKVLGFEGSIFCHKKLFIASAKNKETALKMLKLALEKMEK